MSTRLWEALEPRRLLSGVTLVTHGFRQTTGPAAWTNEMVNDIRSRAGSDASIYYLRVWDSGTTAKVDTFTRWAGPTPSTSTSGETVIFLDWSSATGLGLGLGGSSYYNADDIASLVEPYITQAFPSVGISQPLGRSPIHLVAHSRGGSLVGALARQFGETGLWVDQVTTLDPHPYSDDPVVALTDNVVFADNYFQTNVPGFSGSVVIGAHNTNLTSLGLNHSDVHAFYDGTIDLSATDDTDGTAISPSWYSTAATGPRNSVGFRWSRLGAGARPSDGLFNSATRSTITPAATGANEWDNVSLPDLLTGSSVVQGTAFSTRAIFRDRNLDATITLGFDSDANPDNGVLSAGQAQLRNTTTSTVAPWSPSLATAALSPGTYRVFAKITNGVHTRFYYAPGALTVTAPPPPPADTTKPTVASASAPYVTTSGATAYTFTVTYADNVAIKSSTLDAADVQVTGPGGFSQIAQFVSIDSASNGTPRTATYRIVPPGGSWNSADSGTYTLTLRTGQVTDVAGNAATSATIKTFTVAITGSTPASLSGSVFRDADADGVRDAEETGGLAATLFLDVNNDGAWQNGEALTTSSPKGSYAFVGVTPGSYSLRMLPPTGYRQTRPRRYYAVTIGAGQTATGYDFGATTLAYVSGRVWNDQNANKAVDVGEIGLGGWLVYIDTNNDGKWQESETSVISDASGYFVFSALPPGPTVIRLVPQTGWTATSRIVQTVALGAGQVVSKLGFGQR